MFFPALCIVISALLTAGPSSQPGNQVVIDNFTFNPPVLTVRAGTTVTWTNRDDVPHTVTSNRKPRELESKALDTDDTFSHTFKTPGTYAYFCAVHPHMTGKIVVTKGDSNESAESK